MPLQTIIEIILALVAMEAVILGVLRFKRGQLRSYPGDLLTLGSGACLLFALRSAVSGDSSAIALAFVSLAGIIHALDVYFRLNKT